MFEKVNPSHPDKLADRIAGAIVDYCYTQQENPRVAVEVLLGHGYANIIVESSVDVPMSVVGPIVRRIAGENVCPQLVCVPQDPHLAANQKDRIRCGDNGIFKGMPVTQEQVRLTNIAREIYKAHPSDGKYILALDTPDEVSRLIICQSGVSNEDAARMAMGYGVGVNITVINPLGPWTGGPDVDTGATNRKLGSDMGDGVTGGGLHGKDASKADVSVNIYAHLLAQKEGRPVQFFCAIGDEEVNGIPYSEIVQAAMQYIHSVGGFEKFAEWGLI